MPFLIKYRGVGIRSYDTELDAVDWATRLQAAQPQRYAYLSLDRVTEDEIDAWASGRTWTMDEIDRETRVDTPVSDNSYIPTLDILTSNQTPEVMRAIDEYVARALMVPRTLMIDAPTGPYPLGNFRRFNNGTVTGRFTSGPRPEPHYEPFHPDMVIRREPGGLQYGRVYYICDNDANVRGVFLTEDLANYARQGYLEQHGIRTISVMMDEKLLIGIPQITQRTLYMAPYYAPGCMVRTREGDAMVLGVNPLLSLAYNHVRYDIRYTPGGDLTVTRDWPETAMFAIALEPTGLIRMKVAEEPDPRDKNKRNFDL